MGKYSIGLKAKGKPIKTYYTLSKGKTDEQERVALVKGIKQIQNMTNKRVRELQAYETETGYTPKALQDLRESGYGAGISTKGDIDLLREQYRAGIHFLQEQSSTIRGVRRAVKELNESLNESLDLHGKDKIKLSLDEYDRFQKLAERFYSERAKQWYYKANAGTRERSTLQEVANREIMKLLQMKDIDSALSLADKRITEIYRTGKI